MSGKADQTDSYISMVLGLNGRVRPADLQSIPDGARDAALRAFFEAHAAEMELHLVAGGLIAGPQPDAITAAASAPGSSTPEPGAPPEPTQPADLTADGQSAIDLLLGDYDGVARAPAPAPTSLVAPVVAAGATASTDTATLGAEPEFASQPNPAVAAAPPAPTSETDGKPSSAIAAEKPDFGWLLWWFPTFLLPLVGGAAAWFVLRRKRELAARAMLTVGIILGLAASIMWLRYAERLAAINDQRAATTVIVLPSKK